jgi:hypothetical protein
MEKINGGTLQRFIDKTKGKIKKNCSDDEASSSSDICLSYPGYESKFNQSREK